METIIFDLQFKDHGYAIRNFSQTVEIDGKPVKLEVVGIGDGEAARANELASNVWAWVSKNRVKIKNYLARELASTFENHREAGKKFVPCETWQEIRWQLKHIDRICIYEDGRFETFFWTLFDGNRYSVYVTINDDFSFKRGGILTMGGFKPPNKAALPDLAKAATLYKYHVEHGNKKWLYKHYAALPAKEIDVFIDLFIADEVDPDDRLDLLLYLSLYSYSCGEKLPQKLYNYLLENEIYYYGELYLRADESVAEKLIEALKADDGSTANDLLCAISAIPCQSSKQFLLESSREPMPEWAGKLHIKPIQYSLVSGWTLDESENIVKLYSDAITAFEKCDKANASPLAPLIPLDEICGYCSQPLTLFFDVGRKLATCMSCSGYENIFVKQEGDSVKWHEKNKPYDFLLKHPDYMKNDGSGWAGVLNFGLRPTDEHRRPTYTAHQFAEISGTQVGGMPTAINDVEFPKCIDCGETMSFAAQFDFGDFGHEGIFYFFTCAKCNVHAANYDQT